MSDISYATGAYPRYAPQMAESIIVQRLETPGVQTVCFKVLWTDTGGNHHGRMWSYDRETLARTSAIGCASTEAGNVWIYQDDSEIYAEMQTARGHGPRIPIEEIDIRFDDDNRFLLGFEAQMHWDKIPDDPEHQKGWEMWFGDDSDAGRRLLHAFSDSVNHSCKQGSL